MATPELHPWLSTPEAVKAAQKAVQVPLALMPVKARNVGTDELLSEALIIIAECALPPRETLHSACSQCGGSLEGLRAGAKFCGPKCRDLHKKHVARGKAKAVPAPPKSHIGSMWSWPEADRYKFAVKEVGYRLAHFVTSARVGSELTELNGGTTPSASDVLSAAVYERALTDFEATGAIPWHLLSPEDAERARALYAARAAALTVPACRARHEPSPIQQRSRRDPLRAPLADDRRGYLDRGYPGRQCLPFLATTRR